MVHTDGLNLKNFQKSISKKNAWDSQPTVSSDGNTIIFSSNRKGGMEKQIYMK